MRRDGSAAPLRRRADPLVRRAFLLLVGHAEADSTEVAMSSSPPTLLSVSRHVSTVTKRRPIAAEAMRPLLDVAVAGAKIERLKMELVQARHARDDAISAALASGALQVQVAERLRVDRRTVWAIVRRDDKARRATHEVVETIREDPARLRSSIPPEPASSVMRTCGEHAHSGTSRNETQ
jgi:hypothetical protein